MELKNNLQLEFKNLQHEFLGGGPVGETLHCHVCHLTGETVTGYLIVTRMKCFHLQFSELTLFRKRQKPPQASKKTALRN